MLGGREEARDEQRLRAEERDAQPRVAERLAWPRLIVAIARPTAAPTASEARCCGLRPSVCSVKKKPARAAGVRAIRDVATRVARPGYRARRRAGVRAFAAGRRAFQR